MVVWSMEGMDSGGKWMEDYGGKWMDMVVWKRKVTVEGENAYMHAHTPPPPTHTHTGEGGGTIHTTTKQYSTH